MLSFALQEVQTEMQPRRERIYQLKQATLKLTSSESEHAANVTIRWEKVSTEIQARSGRLQTAIDALENYQTMYNDEASWITQTEELLTSDELRRNSEDVSETKLLRYKVSSILAVPVFGGLVW